MAPNRPDSHAFTDRILNRLIADNHGDEPWADLVLAACDGADALNAALDGPAAPRPPRTGAQAKEAEAPEPMIPATVVEVTRRPGSLVDTRVLESPVKRYFDDAMAIVRTEDLPGEVQQRLVPGFCRSGVEAACADAVRRRRLKAGAMHQDIEAALEDAETLRKRLALALFDDVAKAGEVGKSLNNRWSGAGNVFHALNEGSHGAYDGGLQSLTRDAERLAARIGEI